MKSIVLLIDAILGLYVWALIISVILSWLIAFNIVNTYNRFIATIYDVLYRITEPVYRPIRRIIPTVNGIDFSPIIVILLIFFIRSLLREYFL
ncbi:MAG: YggT family protein [Alphaproteobacteria bacterium]|nr:YggT family protein [Alphaproteobacteria bacterium]MDP1974988.1 YggT family protein [Alphaproteobacteria bacterium]